MAFPQIPRARVIVMTVTENEVEREQVPSLWNCARKAGDVTTHAHRDGYKSLEVSNGDPL